MSRAHATAADVARRLWEHAESASTPESANERAHALAHVYADPHDAAAAAAMQLLNDVEVALSRWIGAEGYSALLLNAARLTLPAHPALGYVLTVGGFRTTPPHAAPRRSDALAIGVVALLEVLIELLGRIVGEEMAVRLIDQAGAPSPRGTVSNATHEKRDDQAH